MGDAKSMETHCPNCGPAVSLDEDLCCAGCGAPATLDDLADAYKGLEEAKNEYAQGCYDLQKERDEARAEVVRLKEERDGWQAAHHSVIAEHGCSWEECGRLRELRNEARAEVKRLRTRIMAVVEKVEADPLPVGEPKESIMLGRLQVVDEICAALTAKEED